MQKLLLILVGAMVMSAFKSRKSAYMIFDAKGKACHYSRMLEQVREANVILFGEQHDNPINHWLQQELTKDLFIARKENLCSLPVIQI